MNNLSTGVAFIKGSDNSCAGEIVLVAGKWKNSGHQENLSREAILRAFDEGHTRTEVIHHIRLEVYNSTKKPWDDVVIGDSRWMKILF